MNWRGLTEVIIVAVIIGLSLYDILAVLRGGGSATISDVLLTTAKQRPIIPFAFGVLMGHLFASQGP